MSTELPRSVFELWPNDGRGLELRRALDAVESLPRETPWRVTIEPWDYKASAGQRARFHAMVASLARQMGDDPRSTKANVLALIGLQTTYRGADGEDYETPLSISEYRSEQLDALCSSLEVLAAEWGYDLTRRPRHG